MSADEYQNISQPLCPADINTAGVIGAGLMGSGIAETHIEHNIPVKLFDTNSEITAQAVKSIRSQTECRRLSALLCALPDQPSSEIQQANTLTDLKDVDLILEAVVESLAVKRKLFSKLEQHLSAETIIASNTSSLSISQLAKNLRCPERFCGIHFCHPVRERKLVEVVRGTSTSELTLNRVVSHIHKLGKSPIVVADSPGFVVNRFLTLYLNEALDLLQAGVSVERIDRVAVEFGMPIGPLTALDAIGIDVALRVGTLMQTAFPERLSTTNDLLVAMFAEGFLGEKNGKGFYLYNSAGDRLPLIDDEVESMILTRIDEHLNLTDEEIIQRLFLPWIVEATRILEEGLVSQPFDIEIAVRDGLGFPAEKQGILAWGDSIGSQRVIELLKPMSSLGARFHPTYRLRESAMTGRPLLMSDQPLRKAG